MACRSGAAPLACATACATLDVIKEEKLLDNATARGQQLVKVRRCFHEQAILGDYGQEIIVEVPS